MHYFIVIYVKNMFLIVKKEFLFDTIICVNQQA